MAVSGTRHGASGGVARGWGRRWWLRRSLRARLTLVTTGLLALGLAAGTALLLTALNRALQDALDDSARARAAEIAVLVEAGTLADPLPVTGSAVVQVVDAAGRVRASSPGGDRLVPLLDGARLQLARDGATVPVDGGRIGSAEPLRIVGRAADPAGGQSGGQSGDSDTVLVAVSTLELQGSQRVVQLGVLLGAPLLLLGLAAVSWLVTGRALRPVAALRAGAEEITASGDSRRLPVPDAQDEVARLARTLNDMIGRLEDSNARQRAFVADAAHELRSPITNLRTSLEVALQVTAPGAAGTDRFDWRATANDALLDIKRMGRLVDDLLVLARLDARNRAARGWAGSVVDLGRVAAQAVDSATPARIHPRLVPPARPVLVSGDAAMLRRAVANLVENATRHAASVVVVSVTAAGETAHVVVEDDGPGIPPADRERVFERFTRLDEARTRDDGGAGLGLAIVRDIVTAHGGTIELAAGTRGGLRVAVRLPSIADQ